jgi:glycosyltransferase involved in cell wall biosynthesis
MRLADLARGLGDDVSHRVVSLDGDLTAGEAMPRATAFSSFPARRSREGDSSNQFTLKTLIAASDADLLLTYDFEALDGALANLAGSRLPHIHHEDGFNPDETLAREKERRSVMRRLALARSMLVTPSRTLESIAVERWTVPARRVRHIPNGVDLARFAPRARARAARAPVVIGYLGALRGQKNVLRLLRAFAKLPTTPLTLLEIFGDGPDRDHLRTVARGLGIAPRIAFRGETAFPEDAYAGFDVFALPSNLEQMPLSLIEAMACGLPVAAMAVGDVARVVAKPNRPFIAPAGDDEAFATALLRLSRDAALRAEIGLANVERARQRFSLEAMVETHLALYREMTGHPASG